MRAIALRYQIKLIFLCAVSFFDIFEERKKINSIHIQDNIKTVITDIFSIMIHLSFQEILLHPPFSLFFLPIYLSNQNLHSSLQIFDEV